MELSLPLWWLLAKCLMAALETNFGKGVLFNQGKPTSTGAGFWFQRGGGCKDAQSVGYITVTELLLNAQRPPV